jgi:energy-coupling factor transporter ATP-binding protein EcfA2
VPRVDCLRSTAIERTVRVRQVEGIFDLPPSERSDVRWQANVPIEERPWQIGLIVGPSGSGKSTLAREIFGADAVASFEWPADRSVVDAFPPGMPVKEIVGLLSSVGFSSPPAWLRPYHVLSTGEKFRVELARMLATATAAGQSQLATAMTAVECRSVSPATTVVDEFTSVVDRTVAKIGSAAVAKAIRRLDACTRFVAVSCHDDIIEWLDPDWTYAPATDAFCWRCESRRRPPIELEIARVGRAAWKLFKHHHYLSGDLSPSARCFCAFVAGRPAAFAAVIHRPSPQGGYWAEHRTVCLPDYQGVGIGNALSEFVASLFVATGKRYCSRTSHPAMIRHRARSPVWKMTAKPGMAGRHSSANLRRIGSSLRFAASFRFVGEPRPREAAAFGIVRWDKPTAGGRRPTIRSRASDVRSRTHPKKELVGLRPETGLVPPYESRPHDTVDQ